MKVGDRVIVTAGLAKGREGVIRDVAKLRWSATVPMFAVEFALPEGLRIIRGDYLARTGV
jgi:hypothetical protein